ncbi:hypothetical protein [Trichocoleus sp. FACHB-40]|uniref:hypothetical protein n=1 Tax=Trichocoleus sp. FACHB-40 TaxID=2692870 RepID=UPI00168702FC|nr:hypothetical protein [Trichocoleus sp. FACHB-40]MBD2006586.1 hypothetical protein [Trichocoleus sp. FACHB-40]
MSLSFFFPFPFPSEGVSVVCSTVDDCGIGDCTVWVDAAGEGEIDAAGDGEIDAAGDGCGVSDGFSATTKPVTAVRIAAVEVMMPGSV